MAVSLIDRDPAQILAEIKAQYEAETGRPLQPAQAEQLIINTLAYREVQTRNAVQNAGIQMLLAFARGTILDYLGDFMSVVRLAPTRAQVTIRFTITSNPLGLTVPAGLRVSSSNGLVVFATKTATVVAPGVLVADILCECNQEGTQANGYGAGTITTIMDPQPYLSGATNIDVTAGGAALESDDAFRERIRLAPSSFSTAGPVGAYVFHARSANANIIDVGVLSPIDTGIVQIYPLMADGSVTPTQVLAQVEATCNNRRVRPLTDKVEVYAPNRLDYALLINLVVYDWADPVATRAQVEAAVSAFTLAKRQQLGQDIPASQLIAVCQVAGVYSVQLVGFSDIVVLPTEYPFCTSFSVNVTGTTSG